MIDATPAVQAAPAPAASFRPPLNRPLLVRLAEIRQVGGRPRRFEVERRVVFRRDSSGLLAEVHPLAARADADDAVARRLLAGARMLEGQVARFRLDDAGHVTAVEREAELWAAVVAGFRKASAGAKVPGADLSGLPPAARRAMLASLVRPLIEAVPPRPGVRRITLPGSAPGAAPVTLAGTETSRQEPDGTTSTTTRAEGEGIRLERERVVDPASGLVRRTAERRWITAGGHAAESTSEMTVTPAGT